MKVFTIAIVSLLSFASCSNQPANRNLEWYEMSGDVERYRSGTRPVLVLFYHQWDVISNILEKRIPEHLANHPNINPVLLKTDCTEYDKSNHYRVLTERGIGNLPVIGIHDHSKWAFIDCNKVWQDNPNLNAETWLRLLTRMAVAESERGHQRTKKQGSQADIFKVGFQLASFKR